MKFQARRFARQNLAVPVRFSWKDSRGVRHRGEGITRDISPAGVFLHARQLPPVGTPIGLSVQLPPLSDNIPSWTMHTKGHVVRVETDDASESGFAAMSEQLSLRVVDNYS